MRRRHAWLSPIALALLHVAVLAVQAPHLVHHAFEHHGGPSDECAFASAADHGHGAVTADAPRHRPADPAGRLVVATAPRTSFPRVRPGTPRSPPAPRLIA
jgi:hypothetical protein